MTRITIPGQSILTRALTENIGWYAGLFNLIGAVGFFLCAWLKAGGTWSLRPG
jgi:hypothetical protein